MLTHGECSEGKISVEYLAWRSMIQRCYDDSNPAYEHYGGRGIRVCLRWRTSFPDFLEDVGRRPNSKHSLSRLDNDGHYIPSNVKWETHTRQSRNTSRTVWLTVNGETKSLYDWAEISGIKPLTIHGRLRRGWLPERAIFEMAGPNRGGSYTVLINAYSC